MRKSMILKSVSLAAAAVGMMFGYSQTAEAAKPIRSSTVYLWLDGGGKCPAQCNNNDYDCPCKTAPL